jgi:hypothetical protein
MTLVQAFFLGMMVALTPSLLVLGWSLWQAREQQHHEKAWG